MARRRMFSLDIVDTDLFLDLPASAQALYFHLGMRADDEGFYAAPQRIIRTINASIDDLKLLIVKGFVIAFPSGVCVITDWKINNHIKGDRFKPTLHTSERARLMICENNRYVVGFDDENKDVFLLEPKWIQNGSKMEPQVRLGKDSIGKDSIDKGLLFKKSVEYENLPVAFNPPSLKDIEIYASNTNSIVQPDRFFDYYSSLGWKRPDNSDLFDWQAQFRIWDRREREKQENKDNTPAPQWVSTGEDEYGNPTGYWSGGEIA